MSRFVPAALILALLAGCEGTTQMTSGGDYVARYEASAPSVPLDETVRAAAAVEPVLALPGRFGLARVMNGRLSAIPEEEALLWREAAKRHGRLGEFVAVNPLIAEFTASSIPVTCEREYCRARTVVEKIRLGAARQHVDAVLIYEVGARSGKDKTRLAVADLTLIGGAFLPTRRLDVEGRAAALLLDVRNGYPYGTATASADLSELSPSWGSRNRLRGMENEAMARTVEELVPEVETMFDRLVREMAARQGAAPSS